MVASTLGTQEIRDINPEKGFACGVVNPFRVDGTVGGSTQGCLKAPTIGLELANAFGVFKLNQYLLFWF